jgi:tetratricopeptide (TPR) repeat protein
MAEHRKPFRPRRLALGVALVLLGLTATAEAQEAGLKNGAAALNAGKYDNAVRLLTSTVNSDNAAPGEAAKALYLRGIAYRKLGQPARAISDLGGAIFLGLSGSDRVRAQVNRGLAYRAAGLSEQAEADFSAARRASSSSEVDRIISEDGAGTAVAAVDATVRSEGGRSLTDRVTSVIPSFGSSETRTASAEPTPPPRAAAEAPGAWSTSVSQGSAPPEEGGSRVSRWFGSVTDTFSSSDAPASPTAPAPAPAPTAAPAPASAPTRTAAAPAAAPTGWTTQVQDVDAGGEGGTRLGRWISRNTGGGSEPQPAPTQTAAASGGGYSLQLANSKSEAEARALWQQAASKSQQLASARPQIEKVDIGNFGTFYSVKIGPFDRTQSQSLCNSLKRGGIDCSVVSPGGP